MNKTNSALKIHSVEVGTVAGFRARQVAAENTPERKPNLRDVVGASQTPAIRSLVRVPTEY